MDVEGVGRSGYLCSKEAEALGVEDTQGLGGAPRVGPTWLPQFPGPHPDVLYNYHHYGGGNRLLSAVWMPQAMGAHLLGPLASQSGSVLAVTAPMRAWIQRRGEPQPSCQELASHLELRQTGQTDPGKG